MPLKKNILDTIRKEHIKPIPLSVVKRRKYFILIFFLLLIWLGIFIVSFFISDIGGVIEFVEIDTLYILLAWITVIMGLGACIYQDSRNIGTLYRYSMKRVVSTIFIIFMLGWFAVHVSGIDRYIQKYFIKYTGYENIMNTYANWNKPKEWRLIGEIIEIGSGWLVIEDNWEKVWNILLLSEGMSFQNRDIEIGNTIKISWKLDWDTVFLASDIALLFE